MLLLTIVLLAIVWEWCQNVRQHAGICIYLFRNTCRDSFIFFTFQFLRIAVPFILGTTQVWWKIAYIYLLLHNGLLVSDYQWADQCLNAVMPSPCLPVQSIPMIQLVTFECLCQSQTFDDLRQREWRDIVWNEIYGLYSMMKIINQSMKQLGHVLCSMFEYFSIYFVP